jgi:CYTH domain-containing protein
MSAQRPILRIGKYACLEIERRYLLKAVPGDWPAKLDGWLITDRYFPNTRLRLRKMRSLSGDKHIYKLTQKYRSEDQNADETTITNLYLTEAEYNLLAALEGRVVEKMRFPYSLHDHRFSIDIFEGRHQGLILADRELQQKPGPDEAVLPPFALKDVTEDFFFSGGSLAMMGDEEFRQGLSQRLRDHQADG